MSLHDRLTQDMKDAMRSKDKERLSVIRMLLSEIKYAQAATDVHKPLEDQQVQGILSKYHKKLSKSLADYPEGDQRSTIQQELEVVSEYLPKALSKDEVSNIISKIISNATDKNFGTLMKTAMSEIGASADGKLISSLLKEKLNA